MGVCLEDAFVRGGCANFFWEPLAYDIITHDDSDLGGLNNVGAGLKCEKVVCISR